MQVTRYYRTTLSGQEYASALDRTGIRTLPGSGGGFWVRYETGAMLRMPTFYSAAPAPGEVKRILWHGRAAVVTYIVDPDEHHPANAFLYVCRDPSYSVDKLSGPARRDVRRAKHNLRFTPVELALIQSHGFPAFRETRERHGFSGGNVENFQRRFRSFSLNPAHQFVGAWKGDYLLAFMALIVVDDGVEIQGSFSTHADRDLCPNDGLVNFVLEQFLVDRNFRTVSFGLSSIQEDTNRAGLHAFKRKVGFQAQPVYRAFAIHPLLRPFGNSLALAALKASLRFFPKGRLLRKAYGVLASVIKHGDAGRLEENGCAE